jgi:uncharacterized membrane protein
LSTGEKIVLFLHIASAIVGLGGVFVLPFLQAYAERGGVGQTRFMLRFMRRLENFVILPGAILVFVFGLGALFSDDELRDDIPTWLDIAMGWFVLVVAGWFVLQRRTENQALASLDRSPDSAALPAGYRKLSGRMQMWMGVFGLSIVGIAFLMVYQPGG